MVVILILSMTHPIQLNTLLHPRNVITDDTYGNIGDDRSLNMIMKNLKRISRPHRYQNCNIKTYIRISNRRQKYLSGVIMPPGIPDILEPPFDFLNFGIMLNFFKNFRLKVFACFHISDETNGSNFVRAFASTSSCDLIVL